MTIVYVTEQGAELSLHAGRLIARRGGEELRQVRLEDVRQLVLMGNVGTTPPLVRFLLRNGIDTIYLTRGGNYLGRLTTGLSKDVVLRHQQHRRLGDASFTLDLARRFVRAKIRNQRRVLLRSQRRHPEDQVSRACASLRRAVDAAAVASNLDELRGHEGQAAATYFGVLGRLLRAPGITFERRQRRPPPDPVNVLLSFGYTMLTHLAIGLVEQAGFDPYLGALHTMERGRPSLALDVIEEFRPLVVDTAMLACVNRRRITPADFDVLEAQDAADEADTWEAHDPAAPSPGLVFRREGVLKWVSEMEARLRTSVDYAPRGLRLTYRDALEAQVYRLVQHVHGATVYQGLEVEP